MPEYKIGDVVQLKSGGPIMTCIDIEGDDIVCSWFSKKSDSYQTERFPKLSLKTPSDSPPIVN